MRYDIIHSNTFDGLKLCVKDAIERGWCPQGGVAVFVQDGDMFLLQAVVKKYRATITQGRFKADELDKIIDEPSVEEA